MCCLLVSVRVCVYQGCEGFGFTHKHTRTPTLNKTHTQCAPRTTKKTARAYLQHQLLQRDAAYLGHRVPPQPPLEARARVQAQAAAGAHAARAAEALGGALFWGGGTIRLRYFNTVYFL